MYNKIIPFSISGCCEKNALPNSPSQTRMPMTVISTLSAGWTVQILL